MLLQLFDLDADGRWRNEYAAAAAEKLLSRATWLKPRSWLRSIMTSPFHILVEGAEVNFAACWLNKT